MAKGKKKSKSAESSLPEIQEVSKPVEKLDVSKVEVASAPQPPARRLFPTSLIAELDSIKARLEELEKKLK